MLHARRRHKITDVATAEELAHELQQYSWTLCQGFRIGGVLWLNDSLTEDSVQEYAVVHEATGKVVDSWTVSWMEHDRMVQLIKEKVRDPLSFDMKQNVALTAHPEGVCALCA